LGTPRRADAESVGITASHKSVPVVGSIQVKRREVGPLGPRSIGTNGPACGQGPSDRVDGGAGTRIENEGPDSPPHPCRAARSAKQLRETRLTPRPRGLTPAVGVEYTSPSYTSTPESRNA